MADPVQKDKLKSVYDSAPSRYDWQHGLLTLWSDQRGRELLVSRTVESGDRVLDAGAGTGATSLMAADEVSPSGTVVLYDFSKGMLQEAMAKAGQASLRQQIFLGIGDMAHLPFPDNGFDVVLSTYSMCPLRDPRSAAEELYRVVRPGGKIGVAHSTEPTKPITRKLAAVVEEVSWKIPQLCLGCRSIEVLPTFQKLGGRLISKWEIGVPLWPFLVFVLEKPSD